jgi:hypothetical protein
MHGGQVRSALRAILLKSAHFAELVAHLPILQLCCCSFCMDSRRFNCHSLVNLSGRQVVGFSSITVFTGAFTSCSWLKMTLI